VSRYRAARILTLVLGVLAVATAVEAAQLRVAAPVAQGGIVGATAYPWSAIGKLNNGIGGSCTAVLISPHHALTAAHCLFFSRTGRLLPPQSFHLMLGYENQHFKAHFRVLAYYIPRNYRPRRPYKTLASDWALLSISVQQGSTSNTPHILPGDNLTAASTLMTGGYSHRTPYAMTADRHCRLVGRSHDGKLLFDSCKAPSGYSGAPILVVNTSKSSFSVVGIHVADQVFRTGVIAIAIPIEVIWHEIKPCIQYHLCQFQFVANGKDPIAGELFSGLPDLANGHHFELTSSQVGR
jgi:protease YdgD